MHNSHQSAIIDLFFGRVGEFYSPYWLQLLPNVLIRSFQEICITNFFKFQITIIIMNKTGTLLPKQANKFSVEKLENSYVSTLQQLVKLLSQMLTLICDQDLIESPSTNQLTHLCTQLRYIEKLKNQSDAQSLQLNKFVEQAINSLKSKNQQFPKIKQMKSPNKGQLSPILQKYSQQNLLSNYLRKNSNHKSNKYNNYSQFEKYSETINVNSQVNREQTRRSLDVSRQRQKKPLYNQLQKLRPKQSNISSYRIYHQPRKFSVKSKLPQYNISKLI